MESITDEHLILKPLHAITDEDAIEVAKIHDTPQFENQLLIGQSLIHWLNKNGKSRDISHEIIDYLRSKGYALPFRDISVSEQIELGWIKLIE